MWPTSAAFKEALKSSHQVATKADLYHGGVLISTLAISGGSVTADLNSNVRRTCSVTLGVEKLPDDLMDPLMPNGSELALYRGISLGTQDELVPLGVFRIDTIDMDSPTNAVTLRGSDRGVMVQDDRFLAPQPASKPTVKEEIIHLVKSSIAGGALDVVDLVTKDVPMWAGAVWEEDRWAVVEQLAKAIGARVFFDPTGRLVVQTLPNETAAPDRVIAAGEAVISKKVSLSRLNTYNAVVVTGDQAGEVDIQAVAKDDNPASPTFWGGPFGHRPKFFSSTFITTQKQADDTAKELLAQEMALPRQVTLSIICDPSIDVGDVLEIEFSNGVKEKHVAESLTLGMAAGDPMTIQTKSLMKAVTP